MAWDDLPAMGYILYLFLRYALGTPWGWLAVAVLLGIWYGLVSWQERRKAQLGRTVPTPVRCWVGCLVFLLGFIFLAAAYLIFIIQTGQQPRAGVI